MNRLDRLQAILTTLQSKRVVRAEELATRFEVTKRTIYRDIRTLEMGGVPIGAEAGLGYFLNEGYHIPPVMFTNDEARALLLAGKMVAHFTDQTVAKHYQDALTKVRSVLDMEKKDELESLDKDIIINPFPSEQNKGPEELELDKIKQALAGAYIVEFAYHSRGKDEQTVRSVEPVGLCYYFGGWHMIAYCLLRKDYRDFRLDRITKLKITGQKYSRYKHPRLREYIDQLIVNTELMLCVIEVQKSTYRYLEHSKYHMGLVKEEEKPDSYVMHFTTFGLEYFARWLLTMGTEVTVQEPLALATKTKELVTEMNNYYANK